MKHLLFPLLMLVSLSVEPSGKDYSKSAIFKMGFANGFYACYEIYKLTGKVTNISDTTIQRMYLQRAHTEQEWFENYYLAGK